MKLSTREIDVGGARDDIVGIDANLGVSVGYDTYFRQWEDDFDMVVYVLGFFVLVGCIEVCDIMIDRWQRLKAKLQAENSTP